jgi:hypothetical protein
VNFKTLGTLCIYHIANKVTEHREVFGSSKLFSFHTGSEQDHIHTPFQTETASRHWYIMSGGDTLGQTKQRKNIRTVAYENKLTLIVSV